jgi:hypothetical protein
MTIQWQDELEAKFGLSFEIIDRERVGEIRRLRGFSVNPWTTGSRFIISHRLLNDEVYAAGLRGVLGEFRARALFILDEAHHAAPSAGTRYAISSQLTKAVRELAELFEHRLFLTATPHDGHSNSFSALLEMLDPQRFTRGVEIRPRDLEPVMVRRLKADLRRLGEAYRGADPYSGLAGRCAGARTRPPARRLWRTTHEPHPKAPQPKGFNDETRLCRPAATSSLIHCRIRADVKSSPEHLAASAGRRGGQPGRGRGARLRGRPRERRLR